jgi:hypothetical protein
MNGCNGRDACINLLPYRTLQMISMNKNPPSFIPALEIQINKGDGIILAMEKQSSITMYSKIQSPT